MSFKRAREARSASGASPSRPKHRTRNVHFAPLRPPPPPAEWTFRCPPPSPLSSSFEREREREIERERERSGSSCASRARFRVRNPKCPFRPKNASPMYGHFQCFFFGISEIMDDFWRAITFASEFLGTSEWRHRVGHLPNVPKRNRTAKSYGSIYFATPMSRSLRCSAPSSHFCQNRRFWPPVT